LKEEKISTQPIISPSWQSKLQRFCIHEFSVQKSLPLQYRLMI